MVDYSQNVDPAADPASIIQALQNAGGNPALPDQAITPLMGLNTPPPSTVMGGGGGDLGPAPVSPAPAAMAPQSPVPAAVSNPLPTATSGPDQPIAPGPGSPTSDVPPSASMSPQALQMISALQNNPGLMGNNQQNLQAMQPAMTGINDQAGSLGNQPLQNPGIAAPLMVPPQNPGY